MSRVQFARMFLLDILGINTLRLIRTREPRSDGVRDEFADGVRRRGGYVRRLDHSCRHAIV